MRVNFTIIILSLLALIPQALGVAHLLVNGGMQWSMVWGNEMTAWGLILSPLVFIALFLSIRNRGKVVIFVPVVALLIIAFQYAQHGVEHSSESDSVELQLLGFWTEQWAYW